LERRRLTSVKRGKRTVLTFKKVKNTPGRRGVSAMEKSSAQAILGKKSETGTVAARKRVANKVLTG